MIEHFPKKPSTFIQDVSEFDSSQTSLHMHASAKNVERLKDLRIENLWLVGANEIQLKKILNLVKPEYLNLYQILASNLTILETLSDAKTLILNWNTKSTSLWNISRNLSLRNLEIVDFSKLNDISQLASAKQINSLTLEGGINKRLNIQTLQPLSALVNLRCLRLGNLKTGDDTLSCLANLKNLELLDLSNQFETKEYAWLASRLPNTQCNLFHATNKVNIVNSKNEMVWDVMVTGKRKPFLNSEKDKEKIEKYVAEFQRLKLALA